MKQVKDGKRSHLLSGESTEKRTILFVSLKISQALILCDHMENLDATEHNAMFGMTISILICNSRPSVLTWGH